jgi:3-dehydroquinate synthase
MQILNALTPQPYRILIGKGSSLSSRFLEHVLQHGKQAVIISDSQVASHYAAAIQAHLETALPTLCYTLPTGETYKNRDSKTAIEDFLQTHHADKNTVLIALGGGVITDITGFTAATYLRGIAVFYLPTTMLAMVDAAIGGKTGINTPYGKNQLGLIHSPTAVYIDPRFLVTQSTTQWNDGWTETLKHALLTDKALFAQWAYQAQQSPDIDIITPIITASCNIKNTIVEQDPYEQGYRACLNIGHTIGHALEATYNYTISHGQAVAIGIVSEARIANRYGILSTSAYTEITQAFALLAGTLPSPLPNQDFLEHLQHDKKNRDQQVHMCLLCDIAAVYPSSSGYTTPVDTSRLMDTATWINATYTT